MALRFFVPLPGPFVWVGKSRAERIIEREHRQARREAMTPEQGANTMLIGVVIFWVLALAWAGHYFGGVWAVVVLVLAAAHIRLCVTKERARRAAVQAEFERLRSERPGTRAEEP